MSNRKKIFSALAAVAVMAGAVVAGAAPASAADRSGQCETSKPCTFIHADFSSDPWSLSPWPTGNQARSLEGHPLDNNISSIYMRTGYGMHIWDSQYSFGTPASVAAWDKLGNLAYVGWNDRISSFRTK